MNKPHKKLISVLIVTMLAVCALPVADIYATATERYSEHSNSPSIMLLGYNPAGSNDYTIVENGEPDITDSSMAGDDNTSNGDDNNTSEVDNTSNGIDNPPPGEPAIPISPVEPTLPVEYQNPFTDVYEGSWFYEDVIYVFNHQLMMGAEADLFNPDALLTRGMVVTVIHRMAGSPDVTGITSPFTDVPSDKYYTNAVVWAIKNNIVNGYDNVRFGPDDNVTREQLALILYRFEVISGKPLPDTLIDREFVDWDRISRYAREPVSILLTQGIISGKPENLFDPGGFATRAEFAAMLHRFNVVLLSV